MYAKAIHANTRIAINPKTSDVQKAFRKKKEKRREGNIVGEIPECNAMQCNAASYQAGYLNHMHRPHC
jgi:hypothetical protein